MKEIIAISSVLLVAACASTSQQQSSSQPAAASAASAEIGRNAASMLSSVKSIDIDGSPARVWDIVRDFDGLDAWHPAFSKVENLSGMNGKVGAVRALTLKDGPTFTEELTGYSDKGMTYSYRIIESPLPLDNYQSQMTVAPNAKGGSTVTWTGTYIARGKPDAEVKALIDGAYQAGLDSAKAMAEGN